MYLRNKIFLTSTFPQHTSVQKQIPIMSNSITFNKFPIRRENPVSALLLHMNRILE